MKFLIFEDDINRIEWFKDKLKNHTILHSDNVQDIIKWLCTEVDIDYIFLDHDIHGNLGMEYTGSDLIYKWVSSELLIMKFQSTPIYIHSLNYNGAMRMESILQYHGFSAVQRVPFTQLIRLLEIN
jgi:hypothetical protein